VLDTMAENREQLLYCLLSLII